MSQSENLTHAFTAVFLGVAFRQQLPEIDLSVPDEAAVQPHRRPSYAKVLRGFVFVAWQAALVSTNEKEGELATRLLGWHHKRAENCGTKLAYRHRRYLKCQMIVR